MPQHFPPTPPSSVSDEEHALTAEKMSAEPTTEAKGEGKGKAPAHAAPDAPESLRSTLTLSLPQPAEYVARYRAFVLKNSSAVAQIESGLRSLTYLIPGRFRDAEMASESLHSAVQLVALYHDSVLARAVAKLPGMPRAAPRDRYTRHWMRESRAYRRVGLFLQVVQSTELLWEMAAKRKGDRVRWRVVVVLELLKALCRLLLLKITGWRMVVPPMPERESPVEEKSEEQEEEGEIVMEAYGKTTEKKGEWIMPRTGLTMPTLPRPSDISNFLLSKVLTADDIKPATNLLSTIHGYAQAAEIMHIARPVVYALAMLRASGDPKKSSSWQPWLLGLSIELAARQLRRESQARGRETALERDEWSRRAWAMGWWAFRGAFYEKVTKRVVEGVADHRFVPAVLGGVVRDYAFLWDEYHFASADM